MSLELQLQQVKCLALAVAGTNGKSTTGALLERMLAHTHRRTLVCGHESLPVSSIPNHGSDLDFLILQVDAPDLENSNLLRPAVSVLLNLSPDHLDRYSNPDDYARAYAPLFSNQQFFDWAVIQSQALDRLHHAGVSVPAKTITFSATDPAADLIVDRGLLVSRLPNWPGPLLDLAHCLLRGPHHAENLLAALAVGHALRLPLESMADALKTFHAGPHRFELVGEINGVQFINDSKASNLDALQGALHGVRPGPNGQPNVWLIAGGCESAQDFHDAGPLISKRVKGAFVIGEASQKIRLAWSLFTPCMQAASLLEAVAEATNSAASGDVVLLSPACSGLDQFRNYQHRGQMFCEIVKSIGRGQLAPGPHMSGILAPAAL
jgi:UDP-N-acetylmuramoylalanine--D-glutamate ligase